MLYFTTLWFRLYFNQLFSPSYKTVVNSSRTETFVLKWQVCLLSVCWWCKLQPDCTTTCFSHCTWWRCSDYCTAGILVETLSVTGHTKCQAKLTEFVFDNGGQMGNNGTDIYTLSFSSQTWCLHAHKKNTHVQTDRRTAVWDDMWLSRLSCPPTRYVSSLPQDSLVVFSLPLEDDHHVETLVIYQFIKILFTLWQRVRNYIFVQTRTATVVGTSPTLILLSRFLNILKVLTGINHY